MSEWKFVLDQSVFEFFESTRGNDRRLLRQAFAELREHPTHRGLWLEKDESGRDVDVELFGNLLVHYWCDIVAKELRVVRVRRRAR